MLLRTKVFELYSGYYGNLSQLANAMGISKSQVSRVRSGKRNINQQFIIGALSAFPQCSFNELFYLAQEGDGSVTEEALPESEDRYRAIFEQVADSVLLVDAQTGAVVECNDRAHEALGYTREEFKKLKTHHFEVIESAEEIAKHIEKIVKEGADTFETKHRTKGGEILDVEVRCRAISIGGRDCIQCVWRDITERKGAEVALRATRERLRSLTENAPDAIWFYDLEAKFIDGNRKAEELVGYSREELIGKNVLEVGLLPAEYVLRAIQALDKSIKGEPSGPGEYELIRKDGSRVSVEITSIPVERGGKVVVIGIARDITERKQTEETLWKQTHDVSERVKELNCLYGISNFVEQEGISLEEVLQGTVALIPPAWQYPEITCARIILDGQEFRTGNFAETIWKQASDIIVYGDRIGTLEVCYLEERPQGDEGPFLKEERSLIDAIAVQLGRITERKRA